MKYTVLLRKNNGNYIATIPLLPGLQTTGATKQEALDNARSEISKELSKTQIISVEVDTPQADSQIHPWEKFAGMWKQDPTFDDFLTEMETEQHRADTGREPV